MTLHGETHIVETQMPTQHAENKQPLLRESVRHVIRRYLNDMGNYQPDELYKLFICEVEKPLLEEVMNWVDGNQCRASEVLGLNRGTLRKKLRQHGLLD